MTRTANAHIRDLLLRRAHDRTRMENACVREVLGLWRALTREAEARVRYRFPRGLAPVIGLPADDRRRQVEDLLVSLGATMQTVAARAAECLARDLPLLAEIELLDLPGALRDAVDAAAVRAATAAEARRARPEPPTRDVRPTLSVSFRSVPVGQVTSLLASPLGGAAFAQSFADLAAETYRRLRSTLAAGLLQGQGAPTVARVVRSVLANKRYEAERIVRSEYVRVGNQANLLTYEQNKQLLNGVQWSSTLDNRTCLLCASLDGKVWGDPSAAKLPVTSTHPGCRCTLIPVVKDAEGLGLPDTPGTRASFDGQVPAAERYPEWFARQDTAFQREVLGPTRFELFSAGKATVKSFVGVAGIRPVADVLARSKGTR